MQLGDLQQKAIYLRVFLEESSQNSIQEVKSLETKISIWAYHSEYTIESWMSDHLRRGPRTTNLPNVPDTPGEIKSRKKVVKPMGLHKINAEHDTIMEELVKIKDWSGKHNRRPMNNLPSRPARSWGQTTMVGFDVELMQIKEQLCNDHQQPKLQIIPIVGMGGIGKTTVARNVYNDPFIVHHFYICAWITLSQHYQLREILLNLQEHIGLCINDKIRKENNEKLMELVYKSVKGKKFLVVLDDMWSASAWNDIKMLFLDDNNGSRILVTTRLVDVAEYVGSCGTCHHMRFLDEEESWNLFCQKVFGEAECPFELVDVGINIAKNCQGLPLAIVVIGGLLLNSNKGKEFW